MLSVWEVPGWMSEKVYVWSFVVCMWECSQESVLVYGCTGMSTYTCVCMWVSCACNYLICLIVCSWFVTLVYLYNPLWGMNEKEKLSLFHSFFLSPPHTQRGGGDKPILGSTPPPINTWYAQYDSALHGWTPNPLIRRLEHIVWMCPIKKKKIDVNLLSMVPLDVNLQVVSYYISTTTRKPWMVWTRNTNDKWHTRENKKGCIEVG